MVKRKEVLCLSIDSEVKRYLDERAKKQEMTLSEYIRQIIYSYVIEVEPTKS